ncbi:PaaI family thioesterase [Erythrobacter sp. JK5]|uniref:PaaI family thioesterase n=1 Tax=Erythrobacter sp. JK5 TaxID=2829500 RepID=UPI001BA63F05|nr:PaaI family thioesterase [Erythrobacter sp. JK5]QUL37169.1 PaaI family thioesterase [Erythrobacter sp. JK5]
MPQSRFDSPEAAIAYMKRVAVGQSGFSGWLQVEPVKVWEGKSELLLELRPEMTQHHGFAHGAIVGLMADNACAWAGASVVGDVVTGGYTINFLRPAIGQRLRAKGLVIKPGKRQLVVRSDVWAESDKTESVHIATAQATIIPTGRAG